MKISRVLKKDTETFSKKLPYDEAILRVWYAQIYDMIASLFYEQSDGSAGVFDDIYPSVYKRFLRNRTELDEILGLSYLASQKFLDANKRFITSQDGALYFMTAKEFKTIFKTCQETLVKIIKVNPESFDDIDDDYIRPLANEVIKKFPCPSWFKPEGSFPWPMRQLKNVSAYHDEVREIFVVASQIEEYLSVFLGRPYFDYVQDWIDKTQEQYQEKVQRRYSRMYKRKNKPWRHENMSEKAIETARAYAKKYVEENPDKVKASKQKYVENNREKVRESARRWAREVGIPRRSEWRRQQRLLKQKEASSK